MLKAKKNNIESKILLFNINIDLIFMIKNNIESSPKSHPSADVFSIIQTISNLVILFFY